MFYYLLLKYYYYCWSELLLELLGSSTLLGYFIKALFRTEDESEGPDSVSGHTWLISGMLTLESVCRDEECELTTKSGSKSVSTEEWVDVEEGW